MVATNLLDETLMPFSAAVRSLPGRPAISTGYRYALRGVRGVLLETIVVGARRYTSREALRRFVAATTAASNQHQNKTSVLPVPKAKSTVDSSGVELELDRKGL